MRESRAEVAWPQKRKNLPCLKRRNSKYWKDNKMNTSMSYFNKEVYVGIDVHEASYSITAVRDKKVVKSARLRRIQMPWPEALLIVLPMQRKCTRFMSLGFRAMSFSFQVP